RQSLLAEAGFAFEVRASGVDEEVYPRDMLPSDLARGLAVAKAEAVARQLPDDVVLAADTVVAFGDQILGKPRDAAHAAQMLQLLAGTTHLCITGVSVIYHGGMYNKSTRVMS